MTTFERIEKLRKSKGISQGKLEIELGFSNGSISKWKKSVPTADRLQKVAEYFGVSTNYLITGNNESNNSDSNYYINEKTQEIAQEIYQNKELGLLFDDAKNATPEDLKATHDILLALKRKERGND